MYSSCRRRPRTIDEALIVAYDVYYAAATLILDRYGMRLLRADEGGMAPPCRTPEEMMETALDAIRAAGYAPGREVALALDVAASHFRWSRRLPARRGGPDQ